MSGAIKPPGGTGPAGPPPEPTDVGAAKPGDPARGEAFRTELERAGRTDVPRPDAAAGGPTAEAADPASQAGNEGTSASDVAASKRAEAIRALADEMRTGGVDAREAIERLVARALSSGAAASLPPPMRAELEAALRAALENDPTLVAMQRDLERER